MLFICSCVIVLQYIVINIRPTNPVNHPESQEDSVRPERKRLKDINYAISPILAFHREVV